VWDRRITFSELTDVAARDGDVLREKLPALPEQRQACEFSSARSVADVSLKRAATGMCRNPGNQGGLSAYGGHFTSIILDAVVMTISERCEYLLPQAQKEHIPCIFV